MSDLPALARASRSLARRILSWIASSFGPYLARNTSTSGLALPARLEPDAAGTLVLIPPDEMIL